MNNKYQFIQLENFKKYNPLLLNASSYFTQSDFYGLWQENSNNEVFKYAILHKDIFIGSFLAIKINLFKNKNYLYIPHGPIFKSKLSNDLINQLTEQLNILAKQNNCAFVRFDLFPLIKEKQLEMLFEKKYKKSPIYSYYGANFLSKYDWVLDIQKSEEDLLKSMHQKTRYNIKLAQKKNINIKILSGKSLLNYFDDFYKLMHQTAIRGKYTLRQKNYYKKIFEIASIKNDQILIVAEYEKKPIVAYYIIFYGNTAYYPFGGSNREYNNLMATYLVHWVAIKEAKKRNLKWYNFGGIDLGSKITHRGWEGISQFKTKFGGELIEFSDFYDLIIESFWYKAYLIRKKYKQNINFS